MKKITFIVSIVTFLGSVSVLFGQQIPLSNLYTTNHYILNPAYAGQSDFTQAYATHRRQWVGITNAPVTSYLTGNTYLGKNMGVGLKLYSDKTSILSQTYGMVSFAYHLPISETAKLSFGLSAGMFSNSIDVGAITANDMTDDLFTGGAYKPTFETDFGMAYRSERLNASVSIPRFIETGSRFNGPIDQGVYTLRRHAMTYVGYDFPVGEGNTFTPSIMTRMVPGVDFQYDINADFNVNDKYSAGLGYRESEGIIARLGMTISEKVVVNYAYEFFTSGITSRSGGSHEIRVGIKIRKREVIIRPSFSEAEPLKLMIQNDGGSKKFEFKTLKEMNEYIANLEANDPILAARIKATLDKNPEMTNYEVDNRSIIINVRKDEGQKQFKFRQLEEMNDFVLKMEKEDPVLAARIKKQIEGADPSLKNFNVDDRSIKVKVKKETGEKEYSFRTLDDMNKFIEKIEIDDPRLAALLRKQVDRNPDLKTYKVVDYLEGETEASVVNLTSGEPLSSTEVKTLSKTIQFDLNNDDALRASRPTLDQAVEIMKRHPELKLELDGYTCDIGNSSANTKLSLQRAEYVATYFVNKGVARNRISTKGFGERNPKVLNNSAANQAINRRVEFKVIK